MYINLFLVPFIVFYGFLLSKNDNNCSRKKYIKVCSAILIFVAAMRSPEWMENLYNIDTVKYREYFEEYRNMDWSEILLVAYLRYFGGDGEKDIGYFLLNKVLGSFISDFHLFSLTANLIFFIPFGKCLYRYSSNIFQIMFALVFYIAMIQVFLFGGARQIFALGFDIMALMAMIDKKILRTFVFYILGITIHFSSILFIIPLMMIWFEIKPHQLKMCHLVCFFLFPLVLLFPNQLISFMANFLGMEKYAKYGSGAAQGGTSTFIFLIELLSLFCFVAIKKIDLQKSETLRRFYIMLPLFTFFAPLIHSNGSMIRISLYFHLFLFLLVPFGIECMFKRQNSRIPYTIVIGVLALYAILTGPVYYFYWQI